MSIDKCRNFADINKCIELLNVLKLEFRTIQDILIYFENDVLIVSNLQDTFKLLEELDYLIINQIQKSFIYKAKEKKFSSDMIIKDILLLIIEKKIGDLTIIESNFLIHIPQKYYAIRNLLILNQAINKSVFGKLYRINDDYISCLKKYYKKLSKEELMLQLEKQNEYGERAEKYVIELERRKYNYTKDIKHVSLVDNNAGYDVMSYIDEKSNEYDKFIEVKCYSESTNKFYLSRNELKVAKKLNENYYLYLVDASFSEEPISIQNPYKKIIQNSNIIFETESISYDVKQIINKIED